jgi:hypothetical protein
MQEGFFYCRGAIMKMNDIEIKIEGKEICLSQFNLEHFGIDNVYITLDQAEIIANEIIRLSKEGLYNT